MDISQLPFNQLIGLELASPDSDLLISLPAGVQYTNHLGTVHGSALLAVAEAGSGVADEFVARFARKAATLSVGDPRAGNVVLGSLLSHPAVTHVQALVDDARTAGATVVLEPQVTHNTVVSPGIVDRVTPAMRLYAEESFGPVVAVIRVKGDDAAVQVANDSDYGLSAAVFSRNINRALIVASKLSSGMCHINGATVHDEAQMPFGGTKASGIGRFGGTAGIAEFTDLRWITIATTPPHYPF